MPPTQSQRILPLSAEAITQIHSSKHITSLNGVVCALLENSLDAEASRVEIAVDWRKGACTVDDNGVGIPSAEFGENGSLGKVYCTSRRSMDGVQRPVFHGSSGTFLAQLAAMSLLSLTSTTQNQGTAAVLTMHQGRVVARHRTATTPSFVALGQEAGTSVSVRDLFGNMPVRIKQRALTSKTGAQDEKIWHELKHNIVALLLAWPMPCSVKLRDLNAESRTMTISGHHHGASNALTAQRLDQLAGKGAKSSIRDALPILFQSTFAAADSRNRWVPLSASTSSIALKGMICLDPAPTRQCQFLALGITPCSTASGHNELYDVVAKVFSSSSFGVFEQSAGEVSDEAVAKKADSFTRKQLQGRKSVDRFPMYYIQFEFKDRSHTSASDLDRLSDSSLKAVVDVLEAASTAWLEANRFRPRKSRQRRAGQKESQSGLLPSLLPARSDTSDTVERASLSLAHSDQRGKVFDFPGRLISHQPGFELPLEARAEDLSAWSNIRVGMCEGRPRSALYSAPAHQDNAEAPRARPASSPCSRDVRILMPVKKRRTLQANSTESGESGCIARRHASPSILNGAFGPSQTSASATCEEQARVTQTENPSSDNFGSINDADLLVAEGIGFQTQDNVASIDGGKTVDSVTWTDPLSKQIFRVNSRTGIVLPLSEQRHSNDTALDRQRAAIDTTLSSKGNPLSLARRIAVTDQEVAQRSITADSTKWLPDFLEQWSNPVFARQKEEPIPTASHNGPGPLNSDATGQGCSHERVEFAQHSSGTRLTKTALKGAEVIAQVDTKFILCKMPAALDEEVDSSTLILIDQHAASERVMLENLLEDLCSPSVHDATSIKTTNLLTGTARARDLVVEVSAREVELFSHYRAHFARWGVLYDLSSPIHAIGRHERRLSNESRIRITHLPTPVAERCSSVPSLAIEMLRSEIWALEDGSRKVSPTVRTFAGETKDKNQPLWLSLLSAIPPSLLTLIHSRSCRSAIMFNDVLSRQQCVDLVEELGKCVFPFVCAHGRVSMVPLGELGMADVSLGKKGERSETQAMDAWLRLRERSTSD